MFRQEKPIRVLAVALLVMSLSTAAVSTQASAASPSSSPSAEGSPHGTCCCGTADARCCGTACCVRQPSNQVPANPPARSGGEKERGPVVGIVVLATSGRDGDPGNLGHTAECLHDGMHAVATLQSCHVRIQT